MAHSRREIGSKVWKFDQHFILDCDGRTMDCLTFFQTPGRFGGKYEFWPG